MKGSTAGWEGWPKRRKVGKRKVSKSPTPMEVRHMVDAWYFAEQIGLPFNQLVTIRPRLIDNLSPPQRITYFESCRNKVAQFARDNHFPHVIVWCRESSRGTGEAEHLHLLTSIPPTLTKQFEDIANGWYGGTDEIDVTPANYVWERKTSGNWHSMITYLVKNAPGVARGRKFTYRLGGPILGKRVGWSRNISPIAQAKHEARHLVQREFGQDRAVREDLR